MMKGFAKTKILLFILLFSGLYGSAQVKYAFSRDTISIQSDQTFTNFLNVYNESGQRTVLYYDRPNSNLPKALIGLPDSLVLQAGEVKKYPLKFLANRQTIRQNLQSFIISLRSAAPSDKSLMQSDASFYTQLTDAEGLSLGLEQDEVYLSQLNDRAQVMVRLVNHGYVPLTFTLNLSGVPDGLEFTGQTMRMTLEPGEQQILPFEAAYRTNFKRSEDFIVTIKAIDDLGNQLAVKMLKVFSITSSRNLGQFSTLLSNPPNSVSLLYGNLNGSSDYFQFRTNGKTVVNGSSTLEYRLNMDRYSQQDNKTVNVYDSYLDYQTKTWGIKAGSIYESSDFQLYGRGLKVNMRVAQSGVLSAMALENNYLLFNGNNFNRQGARILGADYQENSPGNNFRKASYIYSNDRYTGLNAHQIGFRSDFILSGQERLALQAAYTVEHNFIKNTKAQQGASGGFNYRRQTDNINISFNSFYSTPYFTGLQRGLFFSDLRADWKLDQEGNKSFYVFGNAMINRPKFQPQEGILMFRVFKNAIYNYGLGYQIRKGSVYTNFSPYLMRQSLQTSGYEYKNPENTDWDASSIRMKLLTGYTGGLYNVSVNADYGYTYLNTSGNPVAPFHSLKINASYSMPLLGFTGTMQINPYYLTDVLNIGNQTKYRMYNFGPNVRIYAWERKLEFALSALYNYYGYTHNNNYTTNAFAKYELKNNWIITAEMQYAVNRQRIFRQEYASAGGERLDLENPVENYVNNFNVDYRQLRFGVQKKFGRSINTALRKLKLNYFEDHNGNGIRENDEPYVSGLIVKINGESAQTDRKGHVEFGVEEKIRYVISVNNTKGWSLQEPTIVFTDKNKSLQIPLVKTQALQGKLVVKKNKYVDNFPVLAGIKVSATDPFGRVHQTYTDDRGNFIFYLPRNKYVVSIETKGLPFSIENAAEEVTLKGSPLDILTFIYTDERRKIGVTRF